MRGFINILYFVQIVFVASMPDKFADVARDALKKYNAPQFATIIDGVQSGNYAYADGFDRKKMYIDFNQFKDAPKSLQNTLNHEIQHSRGRDHNNIPGDIMSYALTTDSLGNVIDDGFVWV